MKAAITIPAIFNMCSALMLLLLFVRCGNKPQKLAVGNDMLSDTVRSYCFAQTDSVENEHAVSTKENHTVLDSLFNVYGREKVYVALFFYDSTLFSDFIKNTKYIHHCSLDDELVLYTKDKTDFFKGKITTESLNFVMKWCVIEDKILAITPMESDTDISTFEIVYQMKDGMLHFRTFLHHPSQYYGSLDFSQECHLFYNIVFHLTKSAQREIDDFFDEYVTIYNVLLKKREQENIN